MKISCCFIQQLERVVIECTENSQDEKIKDDCVPGQPFMAFHSGMSRPIYVANFQPYSGQVASFTFVIDDDTVLALKQRLVRNKVVKCKISQLYYSTLCLLV